MSQVRRHGPYLDKLTTTPHVPNHEKFRGHNGTQVFPDLNHIPISCKFGTQKPLESAPDGTIPKVTKAKAHSSVIKLERERLALESRERPFVTAHRHFMDDILLDMNETKREKDIRREESWGHTLSEFSSYFPPEGSGSEVKAQSRSGRSSPSRNQSPTRPRKAFTRSQIFSCLLDTVQAPPSKTDRFATVHEFERQELMRTVASCKLKKRPHSVEMDLTSLSSPFPQSPPPSTSGISRAGSMKWEPESIYKSHHGIRLNSM